MLAEFEKLRVVYVPFEDLNVVLGDGVDRILVDRSEVLALLEFESKRNLFRRASLSGNKPITSSNLVSAWLMSRSNGGSGV
jgi:hypothetical protein